MNPLERAFDNCNNCIVLAANERYVPYMSVTLQSIYDYSKEENRYDIIILHKDIRTDTMNTLKSMIGKRENYISLRFMNVDSYVKGKKFYTSNRSDFSAEAYYRLMIPWLIEEGYEHALYIDGDMILKRDICELFNVDLCGKMLGAVKDYWGICNCFIPGDSRRRYRESIGLKDIEHYVISSTLLFDLKQFREQFSMQKVLRLAASRKWLQHDQDVINVMCDKQIFYLSAKWGYATDYGNNNYLPQYMLDELDEAEKDIAIIHFAARRKPWKFAFTEFDMDFWRCAQHTPYFEKLFLENDNFEYQYYVASVLNGSPLEEQTTEDGMQYVYQNIPFGGLNRGHARYRLIEVYHNVLHLEGMVGVVGNIPNADIKVGLDIAGKRYWADKQVREDGYREDLDYITYRGEAFVFDIPLDELQIKRKTKIELFCTVNGEIHERNRLGFEKYCILCRRYPHSYGVKGNWIFQTDKQYIYIRPFSHLKRFGCEVLFLGDLLKRRYYKAFAARIMAAFAHLIYRKPIWLVSDRVERADDNGEAFFKYLNREHKGEMNSYFVISDKSPDFQRMKQYGKVISPFSIKFKILQLLAEFSISSQTDAIFRSSFKIRDSYCNLTNNTKFVFLQHGVIVADLTRWLNRRAQNLCGFVTSTVREYKSITDGNYGYTKEVWLTGMPRFDYLEDKKEKIVTIAPTWRKYLTTRQNKITGKWEVQEDFSQSSYVVFYRSLMHNSKLRKKAEELGYRILFKIHPALESQESKFEFDNRVELVPKELSYREMYQKSSLLVTDYSSSIFDFLYLKKPIVYTHFDYEEFYSGKHTYEKGDFDYEKEGFGEVEYTLEATVDRIIEYMENDCEMKPEYKERAEKCFKYHDRNNCQRVYEKIIGARTI